MTLRFAATRDATTSTLARILSPRLPYLAANDNYSGIGDDRLLHAALRHFARHGLRAAAEARKESERAFFAGDRENYLWWLEVCRALDRRMARDMEHEKPCA